MKYTIIATNNTNTSQISFDLIGINDNFNNTLNIIIAVNNSLSSLLHLLMSVNI